MIKRDTVNNVFIHAERIEVGEGVTFGEGVNIDITGDFVIGDHSHLGECHIRGNNILLGEHLYVSKGLRIGGGGYNGPNANLSIGDRCTLHNNFINLCEGVVIGDDVGLSQEASLITHGYWQSVLEGYPAEFKGITIKNNSIIGYRTTILPGVTIGEGVVIGACSVVTKDCLNGVYGGNPAKFLKAITEPTEPQKRYAIDKMMIRYADLATFHDMDVKVTSRYPIVGVDEFTVNVETGEYKGKESRESDHLRDFLRKYGIRIYSERGFG